MDEEAEKKLVSQAQKDPQAFGQLFEAYYPKISKYVLRRTADVNLAQDITSDVFYKALKNIWQFRWRNVPFSAWLYRIATNEINAYFRRPAVRKQLSLDTLLENKTFQPKDAHDIVAERMEAEEQLERHHAFLIVQKHLATLPPDYQDVIALRFFEQKTIAEIASILNKKEGTIKSLLSRGLERLRAQMKEEQGKAQPLPKSGIIQTEP